MTFSRNTVLQKELHCHSWSDPKGLHADKGSGSQHKPLHEAGREDLSIDCQKYKGYIESESKL